MFKSKYIFRVDDVAPNMNWHNFNKLKSIFTEYDVKPLIGVIPENQDPYLKSFDKCIDDFWVQIRRLHNNLGWPVALHGYNHVYRTDNPGLLKINKRSEFAGLSEKEQKEKIILGKLKLEMEGLKISAFMAPSHSFDETTLKVLAGNNICVISDGFGIYPYKRKNIIFIPQLFATPKKMPFGLYTFCLHPNFLTGSEINNIEKFIRYNKTSIITFDEAVSSMTDRLWQHAVNSIVRMLMGIRFEMRALINS